MEDAENALRHHGNQSSGRRDISLYEAAAQCERSMREGRSTDKIFLVLREIQRRQEGLFRLMPRCNDGSPAEEEMMAVMLKQPITFADSIMGICQCLLCRFNILCLCVGHSLLQMN